MAEERSGSVVECLTWDLGVTPFRLTRGTVGGWWLFGGVLDSRLMGYQFEPHRRHCIVSLSARHFILCIVLVQTRKTHPNMMEKLLTGLKESNQTKPEALCCVRVSKTLLSFA